MSDLVNSQLGQYHLIEAIGHGGMATVYKAYQESLDRYVAIKVLLSNRDPQFAARFKREARAIAALQHHNILPIYDYGEQNGLLYFVMQYVENGLTLHEMLGKPMPPAQTLRIIGHVLSALDYAHGRGIIHRDLKPANILMPSPNWALLADFGIAKLMNDSQHLTMTGFIIGTAAYMAPEQAAGRPVDGRTDIYSLGVVMFEMLTGQVPFDADTPMAVLTKHVYEPPPPPRSLNPNLPAEVEAVLLRALAKDPNNRYQSAGEMAADVERVAVQFDRPRPPSQVTSLYQSGVDAFQKGRWNDAVDQFSRLVVLAPEYEDATMLLNAARLAQAQSTEQAARLAAADQARPAAPTPARPVSRPEPQALPIPQPVAPAATDPTPRSGLPSPTPFASQSPNVYEAQTKPYVPASAGPAAAAFPSGSQAGEESEPPARRKTGLWIAIAATLLLLAGAGGALAYSNGRATSATPAPAAAAVIATSAPSARPTASPTTAPTDAPTEAPTAAPTDAPTAAPTEAPTVAPTAAPTEAPPPAPNAVVSIDKMNLRTGPGQAYPSAGVYPQGTALDVIGKDATGAWVQVTAPDGRKGWMQAKFLRINVELGEVPVVAAPPTATPRPTIPPTPVPTAIPVPPTPVPEAPTAVPPTPTATVDSGGGGSGGSKPPRKDPTTPPKKDPTTPPKGP